MKRIHFLLSSLICIITVTTSNAMLLPRITALFGRSMNKHYAQATLRFSTDETMRMLNVMDPKNIAQSSEAAIHRHAGEGCSNNMVRQWLSYALYFAKDNPHVEHKYAQLIDCTLKYAAADNVDYVNAPLWNEKNILWYPPQCTFALHRTAMYNLENIAGVLLKHKANVSLKDRRNRTALHWAANKPAIVSMLIKHQSPINVQDEDGNTPLHFVSNAVMPTLLAHGADISIKNKQKETLGAYVDYVRSRGWVLEENLADQVIIDARTALIEAYVNDNAISAEDKEGLVNALVDLDRGDYRREWRFDGVTPPMRALLYRDEERFEIFLNHASPAALVKQLNPLQLAASCGAVKYEESKKMVHMLDEYKQKHVDCKA